MPKKRTTRIYWRSERAYGDFRDIGGGREALRAPGEAGATTDPDVATALVTRRVKELEERNRFRALGIQELPSRGLREFASHHIAVKKRQGKVTSGWVHESTHQLDRATAYFGADRPLWAITPKDVEGWWQWLAEIDSGRGTKLSGGTIRHHLNTLSNLYQRAQTEGLVEVGYNPVRALVEKPSANVSEAHWLEVPDAALYLEAARTYVSSRPRRSTEWPYELVATLLLTGGRKSEVFGLCVSDISLERGTVTFRTNEFRRLKTRNSYRVVPLVPQLRAILRRHILARGTGLLFPSHRDTGMLTGVQKMLDAIGSRAGFSPGEIGTKVFRHTFCAAALQTLDNGQPVSKYTVQRWMGHGGSGLVDRIYGHLGDIRHRSDQVEFRVEQHTDLLAKRLRALAV